MCWMKHFQNETPLCCVYLWDSVVVVSEMCVVDIVMIVFLEVVVVNVRVHCVMCVISGG